MLFVLSTLLALTAAVPSNSRPEPWGPWTAKSHSLRRSKRQTGSTSTCASSAEFAVKAPQKNIFLGLTDQEAADVTSFLHAQAALNLTSVVNATAWDNVILTVELLQPNKSDALSYLDSGAQAPARYAKTTLQFGATLEPYIQEYMVGPLPATNGTATNGTASYAELNYIYNKGSGRQRVYNADALALATFNVEVGAGIADITQALLNGTATGAANDTLLIAGSDPLIHENGRVMQWNEFYGLRTGELASETLLPTGLQFKIDVTGRDPSQWSVKGWYYNGLFWTSIEDFRNAFNSPDFLKPGPNVDGAWTSTDQQGPLLPHDELYPPVTVQPDGRRFGVDVEEKYVEWMDFSFFISTTRDTGVQLHNIKYKGERVIYEVGLQEAMAHYASSDPLHSTIAYLDSYYGFGPSTWQLVDGFDCPAYATYLNTSFYASETSHTHPNSLCLFEADAGYPIQRHLSANYVSATTNIVFNLRSVATVGNYDYMFEYAFHLDGSIAVTVRASGYIQASFFSNASDYGFHIHDNLSGGLHDHVLNYKLDLDVLGTQNSLMKMALVPATVTYPWAGGQPRNTMKLERSFITSEDQGKLDFALNGAVMYSVVNKDAPNEFGEYPGWRLAPNSGNMATLTAQNSTSLGQAANWVSHNLFVVQRKDTEPRSAYPYNNLDVDSPVVDFNKFFDGESLDQEDLVIYFNLGMHHVPNTADLPNTVFTSAQSSMLIAPQNYLPSDPSRQTIHQVRLNFLDANVTDQLTFGTKQPTCMLDTSSVAPELSSFVGEVLIPKYPYDPLNTIETNPGG
ncbi:MAG: hypothetical protein Q9187_007909 [Circinaria calcarea]